MASRAHYARYITTTAQRPVIDKGEVIQVSEEEIDFWPYCSATQITVEDPGSTEFRTAYTKALRELKTKYEHLEPEFSDDDMMELLSPEERKQGWSYPLTRTEQKQEFGVVVCEHERFMAHLQEGHLDVVQDYLSNPKKRRAIDVNFYDRAGFTPLHYAAQLDLPEVVRALLDGDADPNLKDKVNGMTALQMAEVGVDAERGPNEDVIEVLRADGVRA